MSHVQRDKISCKHLSVSEGALRRNMPLRLQFGNCSDSAQLASVVWMRSVDPPTREGITETLAV